MIKTKFIHARISYKTFEVTFNYLFVKGIPTNQIGYASINYLFAKDILGFTNQIRNRTKHWKLPSAAMV